MEFTPDYRHVVAVARNERPGRLPIYEHLINDAFIEAVLDEPFSVLAGGDAGDLRRYFELTCEFYRRMTYDTVSYEVCITSILPGGGALLGGRSSPGPTSSSIPGTSCPGSSGPWPDRDSNCSPSVSRRA